MKSVEMSSPSSSTPPTTVKPATMTLLCSVSHPQSLLMTILDPCVWWPRVASSLLAPAAGSQAGEIFSLEVQTCIN